MIFSFLLPCLRPFLPHLFGQSLLITCWAIDQSLRPYLVKKILDAAVFSGQTASFGPLFLVLGVYWTVSFAISLSYRCYDILWLFFNPPLKKAVGEAFLNRLLQHSHLFFQNQLAGSLSSQMKEVMSGVPDLCRHLMDNLVYRVLTVSIAVYCVSTLHWKFSLLLSIWSLTFITGSAWLSFLGRQHFQAAAEVRSAVIGRAVDLFSNMLSVRLFSRQSFEKAQFSDQLKTWVQADQKRDWFLVKLFTFQGLSFTCYQGGCFFLLATRFQAGELTAGDFGFLMTLNLGLIEALWTLAKDLSFISETWGNVSQGLQRILAPLQIQDALLGTLPPPEKGQLHFDRVCFHYRKTSPLFQDLSFQIQAGEKIGLVGYSGSGKTTLIHLLLRLYEVDSGQILIDGQNIAHLPQTVLREKISVIPQDLSLFHRSLLDNIRYGRLEATEEDVQEAAKKAYAHEFVSQLPQGYASLVGERGVKLSGGQRQRIAIARAFLKQAPILVLDEATSQLDSLTEKQIQSALWTLMQGKTTLVIAHRLSTLLEMDRLLVFHQGKKVEEGTHAQLLALEGQYAQLWKTQVGGFLGDQPPFTAVP